MAGQKRKVLKYSKFKKFSMTFWSRVEINANDNDACWLWAGGCNSTKKHLKYGLVWLGGKNYLATRVAYCLHNKTNVGDVDILHTCDTPQCCNPHHLYAGTPTDNMRDRKLRDRANIPKGEGHYNAILSNDTVREIRKMHKTWKRHLRKIKKHKRKAQGVSPGGICKKFALSRAVVDSIITKRAWKHIR